VSDGTHTVLEGRIEEVASMIASEVIGTLCCLCPGPLKRMNWEREASP
jgi:hypothetical protein